VKGVLYAVARAQCLPHCLIVAPILEAEAIGLAVTGAEKRLHHIHVGFGFKAGAHTAAPPRLLPVDVALLKAREGGGDAGVELRAAGSAIGDFWRELHF